MVAPVITVVSCSWKSSAVSVSTFPGLACRESAPSWPFGLPVAKKKGAAHRGVATHAIIPNVMPIRAPRDTIIFFGVLISFKKSLNLFILDPFFELNSVARLE
jgi:hypothetical protein